MKRLPLFVLAASLSLSLVAAACGGAAPAPTQAPTQPPKAAEPTKAPAAPTAAPKAAGPTKPAATVAPTAAPAAKVDFPQKGKAITFIVPNPAGGASDLAARVLSPLLEKELGVPVQVVNKAGAASQIGLTELTQSKPDGHTIALTNLPGAIGTYADPERKATYGRKDIQTVALHHVDPAAVAVKADSPYKTLKDLVDAAKASPGKLKGSTDGLQGEDHLTTLQFNKLAGIQISPVHFEGGAPANTALLGGHVDVRFGKVSVFVAPAKSQQVRVLAVMDKEESKFHAGVKTAEAQGYKLYIYSSRGVSAPGGTPKPIVDLISDTIKKVMTAEEHTKKMDELGLTQRYLNANDFSVYWDDIEKTVRPLLDEAKKQ